MQQTLSISEVLFSGNFGSRRLKNNHLYMRALHINMLAFGNFLLYLPLNPTHRASAAG